VIGLGQLGLPLAAALAASGLTPWVFDRDLARSTLAATHGARIAGSVAEAAAAPVVLTVLPDDTALDTVCTGAAGLLSSMPAGGVHLCVGTIGVGLARMLRGAHRQAGQGFIACPVFGRPDEAWAADLTAVFGASPDCDPIARSHARAAIACVAPRIHEVATPEGACAVKLAGNLMIASAIATMTEAFALAGRCGVPPAQVQEIVTGKLFRGPVYEGVGRAVARAATCAASEPQGVGLEAPLSAGSSCAGSSCAAASDDARLAPAPPPAAAAPPPAPGFTVRLGLKDLVLLEAAAHGLECPMPVADVVRARLSQAVRDGHAGRDWSELPDCHRPRATLP